MVMFKRHMPLATLVGLAFGSAEKSVATVSLLNSKQFEMAVGDGFRQRGYEVERYAGPVDDGVDLALIRGRERRLVRCEQWRAQPIGVMVMHKLELAIAREGMQGGYVVTSGRFTREAREFAREHNIELVDEKNIDELIKR
jgi:restriction system protein